MAPIARHAASGLGRADVGDRCVEEGGSASAPPLRSLPDVSRAALPLPALALAALALTLAAFGTTATRASADEADRITTELALEPALLSATGAGRIPFRAERPKDAAGPNDADSPLFARIKMASSKGLLVAFATHPETPRIWVDRDFDGSLLDEPPLWFRTPRPGMPSSLLVEILAPYEDEALPQPVALRLTWVPQAAADHVTLQAQVHRLGTVVLAGRLRPVAITDGSFDASFEDERDTIYVDLDGDGVIGSVGTRAERIPRGKPFRVGTETWIATVPSRTGRVVEFQRSDEVVEVDELPAWPTPTRRTAGEAPVPPTESVADLLRRFVAERGKPFGERTATISLLGRTGAKEAGQALIDLGLKDDDASVRSYALRALGHPAYLDPFGTTVLDLARSAKGAEGAAALDALFGMAHPAREKTFRDALTDADVSRAGAAALALAYEEGPGTRALFEKSIAKPPSPAHAHQIYAQGVRNLVAAPSSAWLTKVAEIPYPILQAIVLEDLLRLRAPESLVVAKRLAATRRPPAALVQALVRTFGGVGDADSVRALIGMLDQDEDVAVVRTAVLGELARLRGAAAKRALIDALGAKSAGTRLVAAITLATFRDPDVGDALLARLKKERDDEVLVAIYTALGEHDEVRAIPALLDAGKSSRKQPARGAAQRALGRLGFAHDRVRPFLIALLGSRDAEERIIALDAAVAARDADLFGAIVPSLAHEGWAVRLAAILALAAPRVADAIPPLIERLEIEPMPRVRDALVTALFDLTAQPFHDDAAIWKRWWSDHGAGFVVPEVRPKAPESHVGGTQAGFFGLPVRSERVVFVVDQSGSMSADMGGEALADGRRNNRLDAAIGEVMRAVAGIGPKGKASVILFDTQVRSWNDTLQTMNAATTKALRSHLESLRPQGGTNIYDALERALRMPDVDTVFLLSDGVPGAGAYVTTPDILQAVRRENHTRRIAIHTVSLGMESDLLRRLAQENAGRYVRR